jgi:hypothetical protein
MTRGAPSTVGLARLAAMARAPGERTYLADEGQGRHAASAWWNSLCALERQGLVQRARGRMGLLLAYELTDAGRALTASETDPPG